MFLLRVQHELISNFSVSFECAQKITLLTTCLSQISQGMRDRAVTTGCRADVP